MINSLDSVHATMTVHSSVRFKILSRFGSGNWPIDQCACVSLERNAFAKAFPR